MYNSYKFFSVVSLSLLILICFLIPNKIFSATVDELQAQITAKAQRIKELEKEIAQYESVVVKTKEEGQTLKDAVKQLDNTKRKLQTEIQVTETKIDQIDATIDSLEIGITKTAKRIDEQLAGMGSAFRVMYRSSDRSPVEILFSGNTVSESWHDVVMLSEVKDGMSEQAERLDKAKNELKQRQREKESQKKNLESLQNKLSDQQEITETNKREKSILLNVTKNKEVVYSKLLADRKVQKERFETEMYEYESRLKLALDEEKLPSAGSGALAWPVDVVRITQEFGHTEFSKKTSVYAGKGHNGIDLGVSVGTSVYSARSGVIAGTGNTDLGCPGGSYGKWILITHDNGLSTLYAHLSLIKVSVGQRVEPRQLIAYSGKTGYSTGPHLHFTVYATQGVQITTLSRSSSCGLVPVSPLNGYLNPLLYLNRR